MEDSPNMKKGNCIKCGSREVYVSEGMWGQYGSFLSNTIPVALLSNAVLQNYVCTDCGYVESYVKERTKLEKIKNKWNKAG